MPSAVMDAAAAMATKQLNLGQNDSTSPQGLSPEIDSDKTLEEITRSALHATGASGIRPGPFGRRGYVMPVQFRCAGTAGWDAPEHRCRIHRDVCANRGGRALRRYEE